MEMIQNSDHVPCINKEKEVQILLSRCNTVQTEHMCRFWCIRTTFVDCNIKINTKVYYFLQITSPY